LVRMFVMALLVKIKLDELLDREYLPTDVSDDGARLREPLLEERRYDSTS
jgi:hypothetical protein